MNPIGEDFCYAYASNCLDVGDPSLPDVTFCLRVRANYVYARNGINGDSYRKVDLARAFSVPVDDLMASDENITNRILDQMFVPPGSRELVRERIMECARSMLPHETEIKVLEMIVAFGITCDADQFFDLDMVTSCEPGAVCAICLEVIAAGSEAARTVCLHLFHRDCIYRWLEKSDFCPLCRSDICLGEVYC